MIAAPLPGPPAIHRASEVQRVAGAGD